MSLTWRICGIVTAGRYAVDRNFLGLRVYFQAGFIINTFSLLPFPYFKKRQKKNRECRNRDMVKVIIKTCFYVKTMQ